MILISWASNASMISSGMASGDGYVHLNAIAIAPNGNVYAACYPGIFMRSPSQSLFTLVDNSRHYVAGLATAPNGDVYAVDTAAWKQTGGSGSFVSYATWGNASTSGVSVAPDNSIYISFPATSSSYILKQTNGVGGWTDITAGNPGGAQHYDWHAVLAAKNNAIYADRWSGNIYKGNGTWPPSSFGLLTTSGIDSNLAVDSLGNIYKSWGTDIYMQTNGSGAFNALGINPPSGYYWGGISCSPGPLLYTFTNGSSGSGDIYTQFISVTNPNNFFQMYYR